MKFIILVLVSVTCLVDGRPPNIVFILTDDQDVALFGQYPMPKTKKLIADQGITFENMFVTSPLCCPSRSSILTGKYVHNHLATNNSLQGNCSSQAWQDGPEKTAFPVIMKAAGYRNFFAGKYLNQYGKPHADGVKHIPPGWDEWNGLVGNSVYYNYSLSVNGQEEKHGDDYKDDYLTDVIHRRAIQFIQNQRASEPFFMMLSTPACHQPFDSAPQYLKNFTKVKAPRTKHFNVHGKDKHWLIQQAITPMPNDTVELIDNYFRARWRTLLSVDDMVEGVYNQLKAKGYLERTYFFFTSDNGYHLGQFSLPYDKRQLYDFDIRVPLMVSGPGIKPNITTQESVMSVDLAPTFMNLANAKIPSDVDGATFLPLLLSQPHPYRATVLVEHYGEHLDQISGCDKYKHQGMYGCHCHCVCEDSWNNTYGCVRYETQTESYKYCALQDNAHFVEVYDMKKDPYELTNIASSAPPELLTKLSETLANLGSCSGASCRKKPAVELSFVVVN